MTGVVMYDIITLQTPQRRYPLFNYAFQPEIRFKGDAPKGLWELMLACVHTLTIRRGLKFILSILLDFDGSFPKALL